MNDVNLLVVEKIKNRIFTIRNTQVIIDYDLAEFYEITTKVLNQAVKRNVGRFPEDFMFQLTEIEKNELVTICDRFKTLKHSSSFPYAFTEQGVASLSGVLKSDKAEKINIQVMRAFVSMRRFVQRNAELFLRIDTVERKQLEYQLKTDKDFEKVFAAIDDKMIVKKQGVFFDGQIFDAHKFLCDLIKSANQSLILIDNYIDESVLLLFSEIRNIDVIIYTENITAKLKLDLEKYNQQYSKIEIRKFNKCHDRFLIIDRNEIYHIGASIKDLGKKWVAFSKLDNESLELIYKLESK